jgi:GNAT superfamily N-acetyltransferase
MTMSDAAQTVTLRLVRAEDEDFLCALYGSTRAQELAMTPWNEEQRAVFIRFQFAAQQQFYQAEFPQAEHSIIMLGEEPIGRLYVDRRADEIHILDITLLAQYRSQGLAAPLLRALMDEAAQAGKNVGIQLDFYDQSQPLFEQLGFKPTVTKGFHTSYVWQPQSLTPEPNTAA